MQYDVDTTTLADLSSEDIIDTRDLAELLDELERMPVYLPTHSAELLALLRSIRDDVGSEWEHGETLIRESYWQDYAEQLAEDCGMVSETSGPLANYIDWKAWARDLQYDYSSTEINGVTFYFRSC